VVIQIRTENRELDIHINSADQLTSLPNVDGLKGTFFYKNTNVVDLWKLRINFINGGDVTLIGEGQASHLLHNNILVQFPSEVTILDMSQQSGDFYKIIQTSSNQLELTFSQWRPKEEFEITLYITSNKVLDTLPTPLVIGRPIIDGDVIVSNPSTQNDSPKQPLLDKLPSLVASTTRVLGVILVLLIIGLLLVSIYFILQEHVDIRVWKTAHTPAFNAYLSKAGLTSKEKGKLLVKPWILNSPSLSSIEPDIAKKIKAQPPESDLKYPSTPLAGTLGELFVWLFFLLLICSICIGIISGLIIL
jgi:hypothetical protein